MVRVLDAGADKPLDFLTPGDEPNPALGVRGLRTLLDHPEVLRTQLAALAEAAAGLPVYLEVMAPMVADRTDAKAFADACREAGLQAKFGAMVEIPSAALRARSILQEVEFLSLGTNDLAQYTFAADRQVGAVSRLPRPVAAGAARPGGGLGRGREGRGQELWCLWRGGLRSAAGVCADGSGRDEPVHGRRVDSVCARDAGQAHAGAVRACGGRGAGRGHRRGRARRRAGGAFRRVITGQPRG
ncbi:hypothetical protein SRIMM317S_05458 [Streptomyces rimosus subsp. rimosus]